MAGGEGGCVRSTDDGNNRVRDKVFLINLVFVHPFALADVEEEHSIAFTIAAVIITSTPAEHVPVSDGCASRVYPLSRSPSGIGGVAVELDPVE